MSSANVTRLLREVHVERLILVVALLIVVQLVTMTGAIAATKKSAPHSSLQVAPQAIANNQFPALPISEHQYLNGCTNANSYYSPSEPESPTTLAYFLNEGGSTTPQPNTQGRVGMLVNTYTFGSHLVTVNQVLGQPTVTTITSNPRPTGTYKLYSLSNNEGDTYQAQNKLDAAAAVAQWNASHATRILVDGVPFYGSNYVNAEVASQENPVGLAPFMATSKYGQVVFGYCQEAQTLSYAQSLTVANPPKKVWRAYNHYYKITVTSAVSQAAANRLAAYVPAAQNGQLATWGLGCQIVYGKNQSQLTAALQQNEKQNSFVSYGGDFIGFDQAGTSPADMAAFFGPTQADANAQAAAFGAKVVLGGVWAEPGYCSTTVFEPSDMAYWWPFPDNTTGPTLLGISGASLQSPQYVATSTPPPYSPIALSGQIGNVLAPSAAESVDMAMNTFSQWSQIHSSLANGYTNPAFAGQLFPLFAESFIPTLPLECSGTGGSGTTTTSISIVSFECPFGMPLSSDPYAPTNLVVSSTSTPGTVKISFTPSIVSATPHDQSPLPGYYSGIEVLAANAASLPSGFQPIDNLSLSNQSGYPLTNGSYVLGSTRSSVTVQTNLPIGQSYVFQIVEYAGNSIWQNNPTSYLSGNFPGRDLGDFSTLSQPTVLS